ncbi:site-2 protease family protein [Candidatus Woesebacteria bacterium]|nr:site-2 protease family protein [Candidatus Woesebacteria bacterium]
MMTVVVLILVLSFLVIIHELGHLFAALWAKIKVEEFGIGYPPAARKLFTWKKIVFSLNWIPFGGFVRMAGEEANPDDTLAQKTGEFYQASIFRRLVVVLAGATVNFIFGIIAFTITFSNIGIPTQLHDARIGFVAENSPAEKSGLQVGYSLVGFKAADGTEVQTQTSAEVISFVTAQRGQTITAILQGPCDGKDCQNQITEKSVYVRTQAETPAGQGSLGVAFQDTILQFYPWWEMPVRSSYYGVTQALALGGEILKALGGLVKNLVTTGAVPSELAGPVGIVHQAQSVGLVQEGFLAILSFAGMLSINLAVMNVLPIPPLDGGKALFTVLEIVVKRKRLHKFEYWLNYGGYIFLMALIVLVTFRDVFRIFTRIIE